MSIFSSMSVFSSNISSEADTAEPGIYKLLGFIFALSGWLEQFAPAAQQAPLPEPQVSFSPPSPPDFLESSLEPNVGRFANAAPIYGTVADDVLDGTYDNDVIYGGLGHDCITGKAGHDHLLGGPNADTLNGNVGDDILNGGLGNDWLTGDNVFDRNYKDTFVLAPAEGTDTIFDFDVGVDVLGLTNGLTFENISISQGFFGAEVSSQNQTLAVLLGVTSTSLTAASFEQSSVESWT